ncbi:MAG: acetyltransferase [Elusimicrobiales bacterium]|nr:acetyltransferase [Elusimicrobiales bacterium]
MKKIKESVFVFGASGHAKVIIDVLERQGEYSVFGLIDDDPGLLGKTIYGYPVLGAREKLINSEVKRGIVAIGDNRSRCQIAKWLQSTGFGLITAVHPSAQIARGVRLGAGTVVMAGGIINSDSIISENVIVNSRSSIDHDCVIGAGVHLAPGTVLCGAVKVGDLAFVGAGVTIAPNLTVGEGSIIGAGATVLSDISPNCVAVGTPAKKIGK